MAMLYRKATVADLPTVHELISRFAQQGLMLHRPLLLLFEHVRDFWVAEAGGKIVGTAALTVLWHDLAEVRSLAVHPDTQGQGVGRNLVEHCIEEARGLGLGRVMALTYQQGFFERCGFHVVKKETLPQKVWKECVYCDKFFSCDEVAMLRVLGGAAPVPAPGDAGAEAPGVEIPLWVVK